jgi:hypothetical protein
MRARIMAVLLGLAMTMAFAVPASADVEVAKHGACTKASHWQLEVDDEGRFLDVEFDINTTKANQAWRIVLKRDGKVFFRDVRRSAADGEVEVGRMIVDRTGPDRIAARGVNLATDEVCSGAVTI